MLLKVGTWMELKQRRICMKECTVWKGDDFKGWNMDGTQTKILFLTNSTKKISIEKIFTSGGILCQLVQMVGPT